MKAIISPDRLNSTRTTPRWVVKVDGVRVVCGLAKMQAKAIARRISAGMSADKATMEVLGK